MTKSRHHHTFTSLMLISIILIALSLLTIVNASTDDEPSIQLELIAPNDQLAAHIPMQLKITTSNIDLTTLDFSVDHKADGSDWIFSAKLQSEDLIHLGTIGSDGIVYCVDKKTNNFWAYLTSQSDSLYTSTRFTLSVVDTARFQQFYANNRNFELLCPIAITNESLPANRNITVKYQHGDEKVNVQVPIGEKFTYITQPELKFEDLSVLHGEDEDNTFAASVVTMTFRTNSTGAFRVLISNGPTFYPVSYTNGKPAPLYCLVGGSVHSTKARIVYVDSTNLLVLIDEPTNSVIQCNLLVRYVYVSDPHPENGIDLIITHGHYSTSKHLPASLRPASYYINSKFNSTNISLTVVAISTSQSSSTMLIANSTVEYRFNKEFDISNILVPYDQMQPLQFQCKDLIGRPTYRGTFESKKNSIFVRDIVLPISPTDNNNNINNTDETDVGIPVITATCTFDFAATSVFNFANATKHFPGGEVRVFIDDEPLNGKYALESNHEPFFFAPMYNLSDIEFSQEEIKNHTNNNNNNNNDQINLINSYNFTIASTTSPQYPALPFNPHLIFGFKGGSQPWAYEDYSTQLKCYITHLDDSQPVSEELELQFDKEMLAWTAKLTSIIGVEKFNLFVKCQRQLQPMIHYGLNLQPSLTFSVQIIDLIDDFRYINIGSHIKEKLEPKTSMVLPTPPSTDKLPQNPTQSLCLTGHLELPSLDHFATNQTLIQTSMKMLLQDIITTGNDMIPGFGDLKLIEEPRIALSESSFATNMDSASELNKYWFKTNDIEFAPFQVTPPAPFTAATLEIDPLQSFFGKITISYSLCFNTLVPFDIGDESVYHLQFREKIRSLWYTNYLLRDTYNQDQDYNHFPLQDLDSGVPSVELPVLRARSVVDGKYRPLIYNAIETCGYLNGTKIPGQLTQDQKGFEPYVYEQYSQLDNKSIEFALCSLGQNCVINADCNQDGGLTMCIESKCTLVPTRLSPYIDYRDVTSQFYKKSYTQHGPGIIVWAAIIALSAIVLLGGVLFACQKQPTTMNNTPPTAEDDLVVDEYREALIQ